MSKIKEMILSQCRCQYEYKSRGLIDPYCQVHDILEEIEPELEKIKKLHEIFVNNEPNDDTELLDWIDGLNEFHHYKSPEEGHLLCLCEYNHKTFKAENIRDLIRKSKDKTNE